MPSGTVGVPGLVLTLMIVPEPRITNCTDRVVGVRGVADVGDGGLADGAVGWGGLPDGDVGSGGRADGEVGDGCAAVLSARVAEPSSEMTAATGASVLWA